MKPKYDKALIESSAMQLRDSRWQDNEAATLFVEQTMIMFRTHIYAHRIFLQPDMIADIHQDWLLKLIQRGTLQRFDPGYGRTLFSWLFSSMRYHFLGVCLASKKKKFHWENFEIPISQLVDENGEPLTLEALEQENLDS